jgi:hypothetical protein
MNHLDYELAARNAQESNEAEFINNLVKEYKERLPEKYCEEVNIYRLVDKVVEYDCGELTYDAEELDELVLEELCEVMLSFGVDDRHLPDELD